MYRIVGKDEIEKTPVSSSLSSTGYMMNLGLTVESYPDALFSASCPKVGLKTLQ